MLRPSWEINRQPARSTTYIQQSWTATLQEPSASSLKSSATPAAIIFTNKSSWRYWHQRNAHEPSRQHELFRRTENSLHRQPQRLEIDRNLTGKTEDIQAQAPVIPVA